VASLVEATLERWFTPAARSDQPALIDASRREALRTRVDGFTGCAVALRDLDHRDLLPRISVPTLVVAGECDGATPPAESREMQRAIPGARLVTVPAAHQAAAECPEAFVAAWSTFQRETGRTDPHHGDNA
jgi:3-oxoadipate enol-lactonase